MMEIEDNETDVQVTEIMMTSDNSSFIAISIDEEKKSFKMTLVDITKNNIEQSWKVKKQHTNSKDLKIQDMIGYNDGEFIMSEYNFDTERSNFILYDEYTLEKIKDMSMGR